jgi:hypothetical protein
MDLEHCLEIYFSLSSFAYIFFYLKVHCHEIFDTWVFFHETITLRALIHDALHTVLNLPEIFD